jgi:transcription elongation GreA/GreB family factor
MHRRSLRIYWVIKRLVLDKAGLRAELHAQLTQALETAQAAYDAAIEGATHPEARAENDKDTRGLEQSYLARGQAQRVAELEAALADVGAMKLRAFGDGDPIAMSALVEVTSGDERRQYFVAPGGGGNVLAGDVQVITPASPLGRALLGKRVDDEVELKLGDKTRQLEIVELR